MTLMVVPDVFCAPKTVKLKKDEAHIMAYRIELEVLP